MSKALDLIRSILQKIRRYKRYIYLPVWLITGTELHTGENFTICYAGNESYKNYFVRLVFGDQYDEVYYGKNWLHNVFRIANKNIQDCSMMVLEVNERVEKFIRRKNDFYIPLWVRGEIDIPLTVPKSSIKGDLRRIRRYNLTFEVTTEKSQFHRFYHDMYLPYIANRHENKTVTVSYDELMGYLESGACELLLVKKENEYISGDVIAYEQNGPLLLITGIKDGNPSYLKYGAGSASYHFASSYLAKDGHRSLNVGGSRAFLKDGVLQFKKRLGLRLLSKSVRGFLVKPLSPSTGLKGFFLRNPFIYTHRGRLYTAVFVEDDEVCSCDESLEDLCKSFYLNGLSKVNIYPLKVSGSEPKRSVPQPFSDKIEILSAEHIFAPNLK
jgi:hypothetical protein